VVVDDVTVVVDSAARLSALLLFPALGELVAERAGTLNISVEAMLLSSAFVGALASSVTGSAGVGLLMAVACGLFVAGIQALLSHRLAVNQFIVGLALNLLALGVTGFLEASLELDSKQLGTWRIPGLAEIPIIGDALFDQTWIFFALYPLVPFTWWVLYRTRWGLQVRSVGENPESCAITGVDVKKRRRQAIYWCGLLGGLGGGYFSVGLIGSFTPNMTAGRGFIAIAAVIFGGWTIRGTIAACVVFGGTDALRLAFPAIGYELTPQLLIAAPYLLALLAMFLIRQGRRPPAALGRGFDGLGSG
jgi:simple sugar transport system permease protein